MALAALMAPVLLFAQDRVSVRPSPRPGEVIRVKARQEVLMRVGPKPEEPGPAYLHVNNVVTFTQANGTPGPDGRMDARLTLDALELDETLVGNPRKGPDTSGVKDRVVMVTFDGSGRLTGIKMPPDMREVQSRLTQLLTAAYGMINFLPAVELGVGQETTHTTDLPMRLPGNVSDGPLQATTTLTLQQLDKARSGRVARLRQDIVVNTATSLVQMTGGGTMDVNVDRGFVSGTDTEWKITGTMPMKNGTPGPPFFGSIKISVSAD